MILYIKVLTALKSSRFPTRAPSWCAYLDFTLQISSSLMLDFFFSNVRFRVVANLDFSLSPLLAFSPAHQILVRGFPCFSARFQRGPRLSEISLFFARFRRLDSSVGGRLDGSGHYKLFLLTLHHPSQPSLITSA